MHLDSCRCNTVHGVQYLCRTGAVQVTWVTCPKAGQAGALGMPGSMCRMTGDTVLD